jgi:hypothetical protein
MNETLEKAAALLDDYARLVAGEFGEEPWRTSDITEAAAALRALLVPNG